MTKTLAQIDDCHGIQWRFDTQRYTVAFWAEEEDLAPEDSFCDERDVAFAREGDPAHWFCGCVGVFKRDERSADVQAGYPTDEDYDMIGLDTLGACSYGSFREFYSSHRWQYSRRQRKFITDPKSRAWKACEARRYPGASRSTYFTDMVRTAIAEARAEEIRNTLAAA